MTTDNSPEFSQNDRELPENGNNPSEESFGMQAEPIAGGPVPSESPKKSRFSFLFLFLALSGFLVICAGISVVIYYFPEITEDPEEVEAFKKEITNIEIPKGYVEQGAMKMDNYGFQIILIIYGYKNPDSRLVLLSCKTKLPDSEEMVRENLNDFLMQRGLIPAEQETLEGNEILINGKPGQYVFKKGIDLFDGTDKYMIRGPIPYSENEDAELIYLSPTEEDLENGVEMILNMKKE